MLTIPRLAHLLLALACVLLAACSDLTEEADKHFVVGGTVHNLLAPVTITLNGEEELTINEEGSFNFPNELEFNSEYSVTIEKDEHQPSNPNQVCTIFNHEGVVGNRDITSVVIGCETTTYQISGTLTINSAFTFAADTTPLILRNNEEDDLNITATGAFTFKKLDGLTPKEYPDHSTYEISILREPTNPSLDCRVDGDTGTGMIDGKDVVDIGIICDDTTPPEVVRVHPADNATGVSRNILPTVHFSEAIDGDSVKDPDVFFLEDSANNKIGTVHAVNGNIAQLQPADLTDPENPVSIKLEPNEQYTITLTGATDTAGNPLVADDNGMWSSSSPSWTFKTADGQWEGAVKIDNATPTADTPQIAIDNIGNIIVVWTQLNGEHYQVFTNFYNTILGTWAATPISISAPFDGNARLPQVMFDNNNVATVIWEQHDGEMSYIHSRRYSSAIDLWAAIYDHCIACTPITANNPKLATSSTGDTVAVWSQRDSDKFNIYSDYYEFGTGWQGATLVETFNAGNARTPQVAIDSADNIYVTWSQNDGNFFNIYAARSTDSGVTWSSPWNIETTNEHAYAPEIAIDNTDNVMVVWEQHDGDFSSIWANRYASGSWETAEIINDVVDGITENNAYNAKITSHAGDYFAIWQQHNSNTFEVWAAWHNGSTWQAPQKISINDTHNASAPQVIIDPIGIAIAVWIEQNAENISQLVTSRYDPAELSWGSPQIISTSSTNNTIAPHLSTGPGNNTSLVWGESNSDNAFDIYLRQYDPNP